MKKTNIPIYIMYLWAALVLAACTGDDDAAWPEGGVPLELYAAVEGYSSANAQTRATTENRWEGGERVRLWISSSFSGPAQDVYSSVDSDGKLIMNGALSNWVSPDEEKGIQGLYPLSRNIVSFSVQADQRDEGYQDSDCMAAPYLRIAVTSPDKTLVFRHVIAKVVVHLKAGNGVTDDELQRATVTFENLTCTGGSIDFSNGTAGQVTPDIDRITPNEVTPAADGYVRTVRALLPPQNKSGQKFVKIVIGGKTFYYTPAAGEADFFSGKMYHFLADCFFCRNFHGRNRIQNRIVEQKAQATRVGVKHTSNAGATCEKSNYHASIGMAFDVVEDHYRTLFGGARDGAARSYVAIYATKFGFRIYFNVGFNYLSWYFSKEIESGAKIVNVIHKTLLG